VERCDVLVVGGGPAGSSCAWGLRGSGLDVVVVDRASFPRDKVCAGWITPQICAELALEPEDYRKERVMQPIRGFAVSRQGDAETRVVFGEVVSFAIRRCEFDHYLLARAGARLRLGEPVLDLRREAGRWVLNGELEARVLVGAGGHFCPVARRLGARPGESEPTTVVAREVEFEMSPEQQRACSTRPDLPALYFARDLRGYGWVVRKGDWLNVGLGRQDPEAFPRRVEEFLQWLAATGRVPAGVPARLRGHAYLLHGESPRPLAAEGALLVGDAAGLAYARSGEGIRPAVESGLLAARAVREGIGRPPLEMARAYARAVLARLGPRPGRARPGLTGRLPARWRGWLAARALASPRFARRVVVERWFLHRHEPSLAAAASGAR
jgi:geranylgeranyl reductase family protein